MVAVASNLLYVQFAKHEESCMIECNLCTSRGSFTRNKWEIAEPTNNELFFVLRLLFRDVSNFSVSKNTYRKFSTFYIDIS